MVEERKERNSERRSTDWQNRRTGAQGHSEGGHFKSVPVESRQAFVSMATAVRLLRGTKFSIALHLGKFHRAIQKEGVSPGLCREN